MLRATVISCVLVDLFSANLAQFVSAHAGVVKKVNGEVLYRYRENPKNPRFLPPHRSSIKMTSGFETDREQVQAETRTGLQSSTDYTNIPFYILLTSPNPPKAAVSSL